MKLKQRVEDFKVRELLEPGVLVERGEWRVYRVLKRKLTSMQAADALANEARCGAGEVTMCGLKDRQGVTTQFMAVRRGPDVRIVADDLKIDTAGYSSAALDSKASTGNAFEVVVRGLTTEELSTVRRNMQVVRTGALINYFDDQRFGNLRHGQGWIALQLMRGEYEAALQALLAAPSFHDDPRTRTLKRALLETWGDWSACRDIAGKFGAHHSVFENLRKNPEDFAGAFFHVSSRLRLIHLYAYQSHVWNRAVVEYVREHTTLEQRVVVESEEGPLVYPDVEVALPVGSDATFRLPGPELADVADKEQRALLADALAADRLVPAQFVIQGVSGFQLKGEERPLYVKPMHLRARPARPDPLNRGLAMIEVRFDLPRGAYATLVIRRLLAIAGRASALERSGDEAPRAARPAPHAPAERAARRDAPRRPRDDADAQRPPRRYQGDPRDREDRDAPPVGPRFVRPRGGERRPRADGPRRDYGDRGPRREGERFGERRPPSAGRDERGRFEPRERAPRADDRRPPRPGGAPAGRFDRGPRRDDDRGGQRRPPWTERGERAPYRGPPRDQRAPDRGPSRDERAPFNGPPRRGQRAPFQGPPRDERAPYRGPPRDERGPPRGKRAPFNGPPRAERAPFNGPPRGERAPFNGPPRAERAPFNGPPRGRQRPPRKHPRKADEAHPEQESKGDE